MAPGTPRLHGRLPIAWYDFDGDGFTDMVMRAADDRHADAYEKYTDARRAGSGFLRGHSRAIHEAEFAFELNGDLTRDRWHSLDVQLTFTAYGTAGLALDGQPDRLPQLRPSDHLTEWCPQWSTIPGAAERVYLPYVDGYRIATNFDGWTGAWMLWDEDDDDNLWEEMFSRVEVDKWRGYADRIGDRVEADSTFRGRGQLYVGAFDRRIHLYGADCADWNVDYYGQYKGAADRALTDEGPEPPAGLLHTLVRYRDSSGNGFIDRIEFGTAEYGREKATWLADRVVDLATLADEIEPEPDVQALFDLRVATPDTGWSLEHWDGEPILDWSGTAPYAAYRRIKELYEHLCAHTWIEARMLYDVAVYLGLNRSELLDECAASATLDASELGQVSDIRVLRGYASLTDACRLREKYHRGYWLREKVLLDVLDALPEGDRFRAEQLHYTGRTGELCRWLLQS